METEWSSFAAMSSGVVLTSLSTLGLKSVNPATRLSRKSRKSGRMVHQNSVTLLPATWAKNARAALFGEVNSKEMRHPRSAHRVEGAPLVERHFSQKARVEAGTHTNPGQQEARIGAPHCCPATPHLPGFGFGCLSAPAAACAASARTASKAKFRTNLRIHILPSLWSTCPSYLREERQGHALQATAWPRWRGPGMMNLSQLSFLVFSAWAGNHRKTCTPSGARNQN